MTSDLIEQPLLQALPFEPRRLTLAEYRQIRDSGVLDDGPRFEFLEGWIVDKRPHGPEHDAIVQIIQEWLTEHGPKGWKVRVQSAVEAAGSELEPDIVVVVGSGKRYLEHLPTGDEIGLIVEVAESSLARDRRKARLYAEAGIANYWIVNLRNRQVEVFRNPLPERSVYQDSHVAFVSESIEAGLDERTVIAVPVSEILGELKDG